MDTIANLCKRVETLEDDFRQFREMQLPEKIKRWRDIEKLSRTHWAILDALSEGRDCSKDYLLDRMQLAARRI